MPRRLTKQKAIELHRDMWNWIAEQYENDSTEEAYDLKTQYCRQHGFYHLEHECFCCEYDDQAGVETDEYCKYCPLLWGTETETTSYYCECDNTGLWSKICKGTVYKTLNIGRQEVIRLAKQIANLPERPNIKGDIL